MSRPQPPSWDSRAAAKGAGSGGPDLWESVAPFCAAIGMGCLGATLGAVRQVNPSLVLDFGLVSGVCAVGAACGGWWLARGLWHLSKATRVGAADGELRRRVTLAIWVLSAILVAGFVLAVVRMPDTKRWDTFIGTLMAVGVLGTIGWFLLKLRRVFGDPDDVN